MRLAIDQFRQAGIRLHRQQSRPVARQPAHVLGHLLRPGGAVQPHQRHVQRVHDGGGGGDVGTDQQRAGGLHRHLHEDRDVAAGLGAGDLGAIHRGLDLQRVLAGLDQDRIDAAGDQAAALLGQRRLQRVVGDVAEAGQLGAGPDAADHPAMAAVGELLRRLARQFAAALVDLERAVGDVELRQRDRRAAERVGLHHVGAGLEVAAVDVAHQVGAREVQHVGAVLLAEEVPLHVERHAQDAGAHARRRTAARYRAAHRAR